MRNFLQNLDRLGLRKTKARLAILLTLDTVGKPLSAPELSEKLSQFDRVTIYRELSRLTEAGLTKEAWLGGKAVSYVLAEDGHRHLAVCLTCGRVENIEFPNVADCKEAVVEKQTGFKIAKHNTEYFGYCQRCQ